MVRPLIVSGCCALTAKLTIEVCIGLISIPVEILVGNVLVVFHCL